MVLHKYKVIVHVLYPCYICASECSGASQVIAHVKNIHGYILEHRQVGHHRPSDDRYEFENDVKMKWDVQHFGCPSCWFHCPKNFESLMEHIIQDHKPAHVPGFVHKNQDVDMLQGETETDVKGAQRGIQDLSIISDEEQGGKKETAPSESGPSNTGSMQNKARSVPSVQDIIEKLNELQDMFKVHFGMSS